MNKLMNIRELVYGCNI